jgi:hypothetical protein
MQFRIKHLFMAMIVVAFFGWGFAHPSFLTTSAFTLVFWLAGMTLTVRAMTHPRERLVLVAGLTASVTYFILAVVFRNSLRLLTTFLMEWYYPADSHPDAVYSLAIGEFAFGMIFGLLFAGLAAYWTRERKVGDKEDWFVGNG